MKNLNQTTRLSIVHSNAFYNSGLSIENFVFTENSGFLEYRRQRQDFSPELVATVEQQWLVKMTDLNNFGQYVGLTKCTVKKAQYLKKFIKK